MIGIGSWVIVSTLLMGGIVGAIVAWSRGRFDRRMCFGFFTLLAGLGLVNLINTWPAIVSRFTTTQPLELQILIFSGTSILLLLVTSAAPALIVGFAPSIRSTGQAEHPPLARREAILVGLAAGAIAAGLAAWVGTLAAASSPSWGDTSAQGTYVPVLSAALSPVAGFVRTAALLLLLFTTADWLSDAWRRRKALTILLLALFGLALGGVASSETLTAWLLAGGTAGVVLVAGYVFLLRFEPALVPPVVGMFALLGALKKGFGQAYPSALAGAVLAAIIVAGTAVLWTAKLLQSEDRGASDA